MVLHEVITRRLNPDQVYGVLIGSETGSIARALLADLRIRLLLVDDFLPTNLDMAIALAEEHFQKLHFDVEGLDRVSIKRLDTLTNSSELDVNPDFVFIHRGHHLDRLIDIWLKKIKPGGWIGGIEAARYSIEDYRIQYPSDLEEDIGPTWFMWKGQPSLAGWTWEKAKTVMKGTVGLTKAMTNRDTVSLTVLKERQEICNKCEFKIKSIGGLTVKCQKCGCVLAAKQRLQHERCPIGSWDGIK